MSEEVNLLLYSGGIDSLCVKEILERRGVKLFPIRFSFNTPYEKYEKFVIHAYNERGHGEKVRIVDFNVLDGSGFKDAHIPVRNALLVFSAVAYYYSNYGLDFGKRVNVYFPQILECGRDKNEVFWYFLEQVLRGSYGYNVKIKRPFKRWTKWKLIKESGLSRDFIDSCSWTCYYPVNDGYCYNCYGCFMREYAFKKLGWKYKKVPYVGYSFSIGNPLFYVFDLDKVLYMAYVVFRWRSGKW